MEALSQTVQSILACPQGFSSLSHGFYLLVQALARWETFEVDWLCNSQCRCCSLCIYTALALCTLGIWPPFLFLSTVTTAEALYRFLKKNACVSVSYGFKMCQWRVYFYSSLMFKTLHAKKLTGKPPFLHTIVCLQVLGRTTAYLKMKYKLLKYSGSRRSCVLSEKLSQVISLDGKVVGKVGARYWKELRWSSFVHLKWCAIAEPEISHYPQCNSAT